MAKIRYTKAQKERFLKAANELAALAREGAVIYLANDTLCLLSGNSHEGRDLIPMYDRIVENVTVPGSGGGDW